MKNSGKDALFPFGTCKLPCIIDKITSDIKMGVKIKGVVLHCS